SRRQERVVIPLLIVQWGYIEVALVRQGECELQTGHDVGPGWRFEVVFRRDIDANLERNAMQGPHCEGVRLEDIVPAERATDLAQQFRRAGAPKYGGMVITT